MPVTPDLTDLYRSVASNCPFGDGDPPKSILLQVQDEVEHVIQTQTSKPNLQNGRVSGQVYIIN